MLECALVSVKCDWNVYMPLVLNETFDELEYFVFFQWNKCIYMAYIDIKPSSRDGIFQLVTYYTAVRLSNPNDKWTFLIGSKSVLIRDSLQSNNNHMQVLLIGSK